MKCLFCQIVNEIVESERIYEDGTNLAFLDANPSSKGHTVVIPKKHVENIIELSEYELTNLFKAVQKVTKLLQEKLKPDGFNIGINHGHVAGARIPHVHVHIIPRYEGDGGGMIQMVVKKPPEKDLKDIASIITEGMEVPDYIKMQLKHTEGEEEEEEIIKEKPKSKKEIMLEEQEAELFPRKEEEQEEEEEDEEEEMDIYEKMLKRMRIPN